MNILTKEEIEYWIGSNSTKKAVARAIEAAVLKKLAEQDVDPVAECGSMTGTLLAEIELLRTQLAAANAELVRKQERDSQYSNVCCKLSATENEVVQLRQQLAEKDAVISRLQFALADTEALELGTAERLAASQAREQQLREALEDCVSDSHAALDYMREAYGDRLISEQNSQADVCKKADEAIALTTYTTALEAMIAKAGEVMRERCLSEFWHEMSQSEVEVFIRALPSVTIDDLK